MATYRGKKLTPIEDAALKVLVTQIAPNPEEYRIDNDVNEAVHPMGVHVKEMPGKKVEGLPAYKVTKIGSKVKEHGGLEVGEHIHDNHIDDLADMGHKIKTEEVQNEASEQEHYYNIGKKTALAGKPKGEVSDNYGPMGTHYEKGYDDHRGKIHPDRKKIGTDSYGRTVYSQPSEETLKTELNREDVMKDNKLVDYAAVAISKQTQKEKGFFADDTVEEGAFKSMVTDKMTSGKGMSYNKAMKAAQSDLDKGKNIPKTKLNPVKEDNHEMGHDVKSKKRMDQAKKNIKDVDKVDNLDGVKEDLSTEEVQFDEEADFTFVEHNMWDIEIAEEYTYEDFMKAAIAVTDGADNAIEIAEDYFNAGDITIILEEFTRSDINDKIDTHKKAGSKVTDPKYTTKDDKLHAEFTVTDKKGMRKRHIFHGNIRRHENLGKVAVSPVKE